MPGKIVTCKPGIGGVPPETSYTEGPDRFAAIRVQAADAVQIGDIVNLYGMVATTVYGERYIETTSVTIAGNDPVGRPATITRDLESNLM